MMKKLVGYILAAAGFALAMLGLFGAIPLLVGIDLQKDFLAGLFVNCAGIVVGGIVFAWGAVVAKL